VAGQAGHDAQIGATFDEPAHQRQPGAVALRRGREERRLATDAGLVQRRCGVDIGAAIQQQRRRARCWNSAATCSSVPPRRVNMRAAVVPKSRSAKRR